MVRFSFKRVSTLILVKALKNPMILESQESVNWVDGMTMSYVGSILSIAKGKKTQVFS
jgi:hypothetical protein